MTEIDPAPVIYMIRHLYECLYLFTYLLIYIGSWARWRCNKFGRWRGRPNFSECVSSSTLQLQQLVSTLHKQYFGMGRVATPHGRECTRRLRAMQCPLQTSPITQPQVRHIHTTFPPLSLRYIALSDPWLKLPLPVWGSHPPEKNHPWAHRSRHPKRHNWCTSTERLLVLVNWSKLVYGHFSPRTHWSLTLTLTLTQT